MDMPPRAHAVHLTIPANAQYLATARLVTADVASRIGMPVDVIEDLRIAVDEALTMLITGLEGVPDATVSCMFGASDDTVQVSVESSAPVALPAPSDGGYAWIVLDAVCDEFDVTEGPAATTIRFQRRHGATVAQVDHGDVRS